MPANSDPPDLPRTSQEMESAGEVTLTATLPDGIALHARPAAHLVRAASKLSTPVAITATGKRANARSILEVLALGAMGGTTLTLTATDPDAAHAVRALADMSATKRLSSALSISPVRGASLAFEHRVTTLCCVGAFSTSTFLTDSQKVRCTVVLRIGIGLAPPPQATLNGQSRA